MSPWTCCSCLQLAAPTGLKGGAVRPNEEIGLNCLKNRQPVLQKCKPEVMHSTVRNKCIFILHAKPQHTHTHTLFLKQTQNIMSDYSQSDNQG